ncbi:uncharacterized protein G2W53_005448 [Senna tora]|uniref:Uncharacterized protein n=1 Tax=Senna tora TaxID=362788 RepID=A0A835CB59_9FABA|nr:uncharacterized protein G2W53_005448 [Senna tora]
MNEASRSDQKANPRVLVAYCYCFHSMLTKIPEKLQSDSKTWSRSSWVLNGMAQIFDTLRPGPPNAYKQLPEGLS